VYVAPYGLWLVLEAGTFETVEINPDGGTVRLGLAGATDYTPQARLRIEQPARIEGVGPFSPEPRLNTVRGAYSIPLGSGRTWIALRCDEFPKNLERTP
jgi:hypothetical protein